MNIVDKYKSDLYIALFEPRIPQNTGNIARTCAAFNVPLLLIEPLGFSLESKYLKRAGLDYWPFVDLHIFPDFDNFISCIDTHNRLIGCSKYGGAVSCEFSYKKGDFLLFGRV